MIELIFDFSESVFDFAEQGNASGATERWMPVMKVGTHPGAGRYSGLSFTGEDLDSAVRDYRARSQSEKAPVVLGKFKEGAQPIGAVDALKRQGDTVLARVSDLTPRAQELDDAGVFTKHSVRVKRSPAGVSLLSLGLVAPQWNNQIGTWEEDKPVTLDDLHKQVFGEREVTFSRNPGSRVPLDRRSVMLNRLAETRQREKEISFAEALSQVSIENPIASREVGHTGAGTAAYENSRKLSALADRRAKERNINFCEALTEVAQEHPELC